ncbi:MAG TPA: hypothetical protein DCQ34_05885 [Chitinophagaceae bacterium]|nr:hypothetical protein [Chitinophagaceae bacterium]
MPKNQIHGATTLTGTKTKLGRDIIIGMSDGLVIPFALIAGLTGAMAQSQTIIQITTIATTVCALLMGLGGYHAGKSEQDVSSGQQSLDKEEKIKAFYTNLGISPELQHKAVREKIKEDAAWTEMIETFSLTNDATSRFQHIRTGFSIGFSFLLSGLIPLIPYFFLSPSMKALPISIAIALSTLFVLGFMKGKGSGEPATWSAMTAVIMGSLAAGGAFFVGRLFT